MTSNITFREFDRSLQDYEMIVAIRNANYPDSPAQLESYQHGDKTRNPKHYYHCVIMMQDGDVVGFGRFMERWWDKKDNTSAWVFLATPDADYPSLVPHYYDMVLERIQAKKGQIDLIYHDTREDKTEQIAFLKSHGYALDNRYPRSELDLRAFDFAPYAGLAPRMEKLGLTIKTVEELAQTDPDYQRKLYDLDWILEQDEPTEGEWVQMPYDEFVKNVFEHPEYHPEGWFVAVDEAGSYAGMSMLIPDKFFEDRMHTGWTGVDRPYRKKGVATAMKIKAFEYAQANGIKRIETDNHETNWMYQINLKFGFQPLPAYLDYKKTFVAEQAVEIGETAKTL